MKPERRPPGAPLSPMPWNPIGTVPMRPDPDGSSDYGRCIDHGRPDGDHRGRQADKARSPAAAPLPARMPAIARVPAPATVIPPSCRRRRGEQRHRERSEGSNHDADAPVRENLLHADDLLTKSNTAPGGCRRKGRHGPGGRRIRPERRSAAGRPPPLIHGFPNGTSPISYCAGGAAGARPCRTARRACLNARISSNVM